MKRGMPFSLAIQGLVLVVAAGAVFAAKGKGADIDLPGKGFPKLDEAELTLTKVPYDETASAVVLLDALRIDWTGERGSERDIFRRVKILSQDAVDEYGDFKYTLRGDWRVTKAEARTILPDGTEIDASDAVNTEISSIGDKVLTIAFPKVEVGAILDFHLNIWSDYWLQTETYSVQERIPILHSRFIMMIQDGVVFRTAGRGMSSEAIKPKVRNVAGGKSYTWSFDDLEAVPREPNQPPLEDISQTLYFIPTEWKSSVYVALTKDYKSWIKRRTEQWDTWMREKSYDAVKLARQVTRDITAPREKADAIRQAIRERVTLDYRSPYPSRSSADEVLTSGSGTTADIAATAVAMMREAGLKADLVTIRRRPAWPVVGEIPIPDLYDDLMVRFAAESGDVYFYPAADVKAGRLPWMASGVPAVVFDGKSEAPTEVPDFDARSNSSSRTFNGTLDAEGTLSGKSTLTFTGIAAETWRRRLASADEQNRREAVRDFLRNQVPTATLDAMEVENVEGDANSVTVKAEWHAEGYATPAGKRLLLNPRLFARISATDWPEKERRYPIDLQMAFETNDVVLIRLPEGASIGALPKPRKLESPGIGIYESSCLKAGDNLTGKRHFRLDRYHFGPDAYAPLKRWFSDIAASDEDPVVINLP